MDFVDRYLDGVTEIADRLREEDLRKSLNGIVSTIQETKIRKGRLFIIGVGGGAGHANHAVNDFRKIVGIEAYSPSDNVSELTARINDEGWESCYAEYLKVSNLNSKDCLLIFSVGGGNPEFGLSMNIVQSLELAKEREASILGIVGRDGGETAKLANFCVTIPQVNESLTTALTESYQAVVWHLIISHPTLYSSPMRWETAKK